jgi:hypothetical protein
MCTGEALMPTLIAVGDDGDICHSPADLLGDLGYMIDTAEGVRRRASRAARTVRVLLQALRADSPAKKADREPCGKPNWTSARAEKRHSHWSGSHNGLLCIRAR